MFSCTSLTWLESFYRFFFFFYRVAPSPLHVFPQGNLKMRPMVLPDTFIEAGTQTEQYEEAGLSAGHVRASVLRLFDQTPVPILTASKVPAPWMRAEMRRTRVGGFKEEPS